MVEIFTQVIGLTLATIDCGFSLGQRNRRPVRLIRQNALVYDRGKGRRQSYKCKEHSMLHDGQYVMAKVLVLDQR